MCQKCVDIGERIEKQTGMTQQEVVDWLWNNTAFPFDPPTEEQVKELLSKHTIHTI